MLASATSLQVSLSYDVMAAEESVLRPAEGQRCVPKAYHGDCRIGSLLSNQRLGRANRIGLLT